MVLHYLCPGLTLVYLAPSQAYCLFISTQPRENGLGSRLGWISRLQAAIWILFVVEALTLAVDTLAFDARHSTTDRNVSVSE